MLPWTTVQPRVVALVARDAGLATLHGLLWPTPRIELLGIFTHRLRPRSEDRRRREREDFPRFAELAAEYGVPLHTIDDPAAAEESAGLTAFAPFDILLSVSWRYRVRPEHLALARLAAINLHRGRLPDHAGAEPVRRALEAGESTVVLTAHIMTEEIDAGPVLAEYEHPIAAGTSASPTDVARVKRELLPHYPRVALEAIDAVLRPMISGV